jgi:hypothetical protein
VDSAKGHLDQEHKNLQSTRIKLETNETNETNVTDETDEDHFPLPDMPNVKTFEACAMLIPFTAKNTAYHDLTGQFPHRSSRGNEYLIVVYNHDSNSILVIALVEQNRSRNHTWLDQQHS